MPTRSRVRDRRPTETSHVRSEEASRQDEGILETATNGTWAPRQRPQEGNDASRRRCRVRSVGLGFSPGALARRRYPQRRPQESYGARRRHRCWRRNAELSPGNTFAPRLPVPQIVIVPEPGLPNANWELALPKRRHHQDPPPPAPRHPNGQRARPSPPPRRSP